MKRLYYAIIAIMILIPIAFPVSVLPDDDMVFCCIRPCTCLPNAQPKCEKKPRYECEREKGEIVSDCMLCY